MIFYLFSYKSVHFFYRKLGKPGATSSPAQSPSPAATPSPAPSSASSTSTGRGGGLTARLLSLHMAATKPHPNAFGVKDRPSVDSSQTEDDSSSIVPILNHSEPPPIIRKGETGKP